LGEGARPDAAPFRPGDGLDRDVIGGIAPIGNRRPGRDHGGADIRAIRRAARDPAAVAVALERGAGQIAPRHEVAQHRGRPRPAGPFRPGRVRAALIGFGRVDAVNAQPRRAQPERVAVADLRAARERLCRLRAEDRGAEDDQRQEVSNRSHAA